MIDDDQDIEFKIELCDSNEDNDTEIYVSLKSLPPNKSRLCLICGIYLSEIDVNLSGILQFNENKLKAIMIDSIALNMYKQYVKISNFEMIITMTHA